MDQSDFTQPAQPVARLTGRRDQPLLRINRQGDVSYRWLRNGKPGSYETAREMATLVREAAVHDIGLERFAAQILINNRIDSHSAPADAIDAIFRYVQQVAYIYDSTGAGSFDSIQSARDTIEKGYGDCDDLSVLLATLLALVGFRPAFVLSRNREKSRGYDHVYVTVDTGNGEIALDPSNKRQGSGWESPKAIERIRFAIFPKGGSLGLGFAAAGAAAAPAFAVPVIGQIALAAVSLIPLIGKLFHHGPSPQERKIGSDWDQADKQVAAELTAIDQQSTVTAQDFARAQDLVSQLGQLAQQQSGIAYVAKQWQAEAPRYQTALQKLASKIAQSDRTVNANGVGGDLAGTLTTLALLAGGVFLLKKVMD